VSGADHAEAIRVAGDLYRRKVLDWFRVHP
jgi:hypothetical protein